MWSHYCKTLHYRKIQHSSWGARGNSIKMSFTLLPYLSPIFSSLLPKWVLELRRENYSWKTLQEPTETHLCLVMNMVWPCSCLICISFPSIFMHLDFYFQQYFQKLILSLHACRKGFLNTLASNHGIYSSICPQLVGELNQYHMTHQSQISNTP